MKKEQRFNEIYRENKDLIYRVCCVHCQDPEIRKDLFQEIITNVWRALDKFEGRSKISTWIYRIAINTSLSFLRKENKSESRHADVVRNLDWNTDEDKNEVMLSTLHSAIAHLNKFEKAIISLMLQNLNQKDIAEIMGLTENNTRVKIHRIKKKLQSILNLQPNGY